MSETSELRYVGPEYLTCAETAKLVRKALKKAFPGQKFSVRSETYANGASIHVRYTDGPPQSAVQDAVKVFEGAGFDGSIDLKYHYEHFLEPDGTVKVAHTSGTEGSKGYVPAELNDPPSANSKLVSLGADYVIVQRDYSPDFAAELEAEIEKAAGAAPGSFSHGSDYDVTVIDGEAVPCSGLAHYQKYGSTIYRALGEAKSR